MHPLNYQRFLDMKEKEKQNPGQSFESQANAQLEQSDFNQIVLKFMINGMHHPNLLKDPSFATLLNGNENNPLISPSICFLTKNFRFSQKSPQKESRTIHHKAITTLFLRKC